MIEIEERQGNRIELTLVGFCECPTCGRGCTEIWQDGSGRSHLRCQNHECESYGTFEKLRPEQDIAATVGTEPDEATMLKLHDRMNAALLDYESAMGIDGGNGANAVPFVNEMHQIIEDAATVGAGTCRCTVETSDDYYDDYTRYHMSCGFTMYGDGIDRPRFCGGCGRRIEVSER